ncbi:MAG: hypothetical protein AAF696_35330 [Bacteroidota bacterium]
MEKNHMPEKKPINRMNKSELLEEVKRLKKQLEISESLSEDRPDPAEISKLEAERDEWMEKTLYLEEEISKQEAFKREFEGKVRKENKAKDRQLNQLEERIKDLDQQLSKQKEDEGPQIESKHKSSFRLEYYHQEEGKIQGKIEHLISRKKKALKGIDEEKLMDFIYKHMAPFLKELPSSVDKEAGAKVKSAPPQKKKEKKEEIVESIPEASIAGNMKVKNLGSKDLRPFITRERAAEVVIDLDSLGINLDTYNWEANLSSSLIHKNEKRNLGKFSGQENQGKEIVFNLIPSNFFPGPNRIYASLSLYDAREDLEDQIPAQLGPFDLSQLIYVQ